MTTRKFGALLAPLFAIGLAACTTDTVDEVEFDVPAGELPSPDLYRDTLGHTPAPGDTTLVPPIGR